MYRLAEGKIWKSLESETTAELDAIRDGKQRAHEISTLSLQTKKKAVWNQFSLEDGTESADSSLLKKSYRNVKNVKSLLI